MSQGHSIVLAVVSSDDGVVAKSVLSNVKQHDTQYSRTLAVITKPDLVQCGTQSDEIIKLAKNLDRYHHLTLGWHVVRNRCDKERDLSDDERDVVERKALANSPWTSLPSSVKGVASLVVCNCGSSRRACLA
jgi:hypothetical protein